MTLGAPLVEGASVAGEFVDQIRDRKIVIIKMRRRQGYRRKAGHRQLLSVVRITEILTGGARPKALRKAAPKSEPMLEVKAESKVEAVPVKALAEKKPAPHESVPHRPAPEKKAARAADFTDDVKLISGVGPALEKKLAAAGVTSLKQIAKFTGKDIGRIDAELKFKGRIDREDWTGQAKALLAGGAPKAAKGKKAAVDKQAARTKTPTKKTKTAPKKKR
ncbi:MAG: 50S ribosomal protein L21 [Cucumibacter sp.]